jgi:hypothetical protein
VYNLVARGTKIYVGGLDDIDEYGAAIPLSLVIILPPDRSAHTQLCCSHRVVTETRAHAAGCRDKTHHTRQYLTLNTGSEETFRLALRPPPPDPDPICWPRMPNVKTICVRVHPYESRSRTLNTMLSPKKDLWNPRAQMIADSYVCQLRHFHTNNSPRIFGEWATPQSNQPLDETRACYDFGTLYADQDGVLRCRSPGCDLYQTAESRRQRWWEM